MKNEDYVSFELAEILVEKGYPQDKQFGDYIYLTKGEYKGNRILCLDVNDIRDTNYVMAPTLYQVQKWLMTDHQILVLPDYHCSYHVWQYSLKVLLRYGYQGVNNETVNSQRYYSYEMALSVGIVEALKMIK